MLLVPGGLRIWRVRALQGLGVNLNLRLEPLRRFSKVVPLAVSGTSSSSGAETPSLLSGARPSPPPPPLVTPQLLCVSGFGFSGTPSEGAARRVFPVGSALGPVSWSVSSSGSSHVRAGAPLFLLLGLKRIPCDHGLSSTHLSTDGRSGCFHPWLLLTGSCGLGGVRPPGTPSSGVTGSDPDSWLNSLRNRHALRSSCPIFFLILFSSNAQGFNASTSLSAFFFSLNNSSLVPRK